MVKFLNYTKRLTKNNKASILPVTVIAIFIIMIVNYACIKMFLIQNVMATQDQLKLRSFYAADSIAQKQVWRLFTAIDTKINKNKDAQFDDISGIEKNIVFTGDTVPSLDDVNGIQNSRPGRIKYVTGLNGSNGFSKSFYFGDYLDITDDSDIMKKKDNENRTDYKEGKMFSIIPKEYRMWPTIKSDGYLLAASPTYANDTNKDDVYFCNGTIDKASSYDQLVPEYLRIKFYDDSGSFFYREKDNGITASTDMLYRKNEYVPVSMYPNIGEKDPRKKWFEVTPGDYNCDEMVSFYVYEGPEGKPQDKNAWKKEIIEENCILRTKLVTNNVQNTIKQSNLKVFKEVLNRISSKYKVSEDKDIFIFVLCEKYEIRGDLFSFNIYGRAYSHNINNKLRTTGRSLVNIQCDLLMPRLYKEIVNNSYDPRSCLSEKEAKQVFNDRVKILNYSTQTGNGHAGVWCLHAAGTAYWNSLYAYRVNELNEEKITLVPDKHKYISNNIKLFIRKWEVIS